MSKICHLQQKLFRPVWIKPTQWGTLYHLKASFASLPRPPEHGSGLLLYEMCALKSCAFKGFKYPFSSPRDSSPLPVQIPPLGPAPGSSGRLWGGRCGQQPGAGAVSAFRSPSPPAPLPPGYTRGVKMHHYCSAACHSLSQYHSTHCWDTCQSSGTDRAFHVRDLQRSSFTAEPFPKDVKE